jgi:hypothetical protein
MNQSSVHSQALAAEGFGSKIAGGGMAALMVQEQKAREGDPITCDDTSQFKTDSQLKFTRSQGI